MKNARAMGGRGLRRGSTVRDYVVSLHLMERDGRGHRPVRLRPSHVRSKGSEEAEPAAHNQCHRASNPPWPRWRPRTAPHESGCTAAYASTRSGSTTADVRRAAPRRSCASAGCSSSAPGCQRSGSQQDLPRARPPYRRGPRRCRPHRDHQQGVDGTRLQGPAARGAWRLRKETTDLWVSRAGSR